MINHATTAAILDRSASASGKSFGNYYDICDCVVNTVDEKTVIGGEGKHQIVVKSGPRKPNLEPFKSVVDS